MRNQCIAIERILAKRESHFYNLQECGENTGPSNLILQKATAKHRHNQLQNIILLFSNNK